MLTSLVWSGMRGRFIKWKWRISRKRVHHVNIYIRFFLKGARTNKKLAATANAGQQLSFPRFPSDSHTCDWDETTKKDMQEVTHGDHYITPPQFLTYCWTTHWLSPQIREKGWLLLYLNNMWWRTLSLKQIWLRSFWATITDSKTFICCQARWEKRTALGEREKKKRLLEFWIWMSSGHKRAYITRDWWVASVTRRFRQKESMMQQPKKIWSAIFLASFCYAS